MKTYQLDNKPRELYFTNYDRVDEDILFQQVLTKFKKNHHIEIGEKEVFPSEDLYRCKVLGTSFLLIFDIDYGTSIQADDIETIQKLQEILEKE